MKFKNLISSIVIVGIVLIAGCLHQPSDSSLDHPAEKLLMWVKRVDSSQDVVISPNGEYITSGKELFSRTGELIHRYNTRVTMSTAISSDGRYITTAVDPGIVYLISSEDEKPIWRYEAGERVWRVDMSDDGNYIVSIGQRNICLFSKENSNPIWNYKRKSSGSTYNSVAISSNGKYIVAGTDSGSEPNVLLFSRESSTPLWSYGPSEWTSQVAISSDGSYIATGDNAGTVRLFSKESNVPLWSYTTWGDIYALSMTPDGRFIVAGGWDSNLYMFSQIGELLWSYKIGGRVFDVDISYDGRYIVAASEDDHIYLISFSGKPLWSYRTGDDVTGISISSDGNYTAAVSEDRHLYLFDRDVDSQKSTELTVKPAEISTESHMATSLDAFLTLEGIPLEDKLITWSVSKGTIDIEDSFTDYQGKITIKYTAPVTRESTQTMITASFAGDGLYSPAKKAITVHIAAGDLRPLHEPISISNDGFTPENGVVKGSGTEDNPYIIENWHIYAENNYGIFIRDSRAHFVIRDSYITVEGDDKRDGIYLMNVDNGRIENVIIEYVPKWGIFMQDCSNIEIINSVFRNNVRQGISVWDSEDITIKNNTVLNNDDAGIQIDRSSNVKIFDNLAKFNSRHGISIYNTNNSIMENNTALLNGWFGFAVHEHSSQNTVRGNKGNNNGLSPVGGGGLSMKMDSNNNLVENNDFKENDGFGINIYINASYNTIRGNNINGNSGIGINIESGIGNILEDNMVSNNAHEDISTKDSSGTIVR
ncbi:MAG: right-handed parallel beta-helix repeat-containing protein [Methanocellales archaeon]|nr:right-handed parallel beta-helix repeat-containing protein [Methanocellales archaeon]MDD3292283.1 right-handed parallel beta-helix repeat-containing protein [Methanocellales archaeon]MDD5235945.1 right-handed parallel beta-helix repeat-containing protein [Methanocellales archaeon]MDD5485831.1 right-handed parallel beta-helix repeat-containing protein [Methanocellales archaeon]